MHYKMCRCKESSPPTHCHSSREGDDRMLASLNMIYKLVRVPARNWGVGGGWYLVSELCTVEFVQIYINVRGGIGYIVVVVLKASDRPSEFFRHREETRSHCTPYHHHVVPVPPTFELPLSEHFESFLEFLWTGNRIQCLLFSLWLINFRVEVLGGGARRQKLITRSHSLTRTLELSR